MAVLFWIIFIAIFVFLIWRIRAPIRKANEYLVNGLMSKSLQNQAFSKSMLGVLFMTEDRELSSIFNRLDINFLNSNEIYVKINQPAGMILFETKYLEGARLRYVETKDNLTVFEYKIIDVGRFNGNAQLPEITSNIILTALEKAVV